MRASRRVGYVRHDGALGGIRDAFVMNAAQQAPIV